MSWKSMKTVAAAWALLLLLEAASFAADDVAQMMRPAALQVMQQQMMGTAPQMNLGGNCNSPVQRRSIEPCAG